MSKLMLIGASHPEETRVALVDNGRVEDFDFETTGNEQLRGNLYLAKVTRVEPSLQACFVDYGGNRHGFLAFSEIHPDYYQLPQEDRQRLLEEAAREAEAEADEDPDDEDELDDDGDESQGDDDATSSEATGSADKDADTDGEDSDGDDSDTVASASTESDETPDGAAPATEQRRRPRKTRSTAATRRYKIQEVIRRRQVLLVQVVKEERGNKGAALTTYLSLAGRYSVLMPNTPRGGGISRKIPNGADRKRLKSMMSDLSVPKGMGLIVRTAGAKRTKSEIKRDYDYLQNLWSTIRSTTLKSSAPSLIHKEGSLVHRAMRDMFDRGIDDVIVQGDEAYRKAKDLAKTLMPTQARKVKRWTAPTPLFVAEGVEEQLESVFSPTVQMKSGGYLVINQTEALVAIDVNSGKSTRERSIEQTALRTNLEAAEEACRQMRLRDLAGLIVIDFIDMDEPKNNRAVEKKMKDCLSLDRARVQNNRISQFGLMEISRQRRRAGVMQATSEKCDACHGTGRRRSIPSAALQIIRAIESRAGGGGLKAITVTAPTDVALYILNSKREDITSIEEEAGFAIAIHSSAAMIPGDFELSVEKGAGRKRQAAYNRRDFLEGDQDDHLLPEEGDDEKPVIDDSTEGAPEGVQADTPRDETDETGGRRKRRRRGRRGGRRRRRDNELSTVTPCDGGALIDGLSASITHLLGDAPLDLPDPKLGGLEAPDANPSQDDADQDTAQSSASGQTSPDGEADTEKPGGRRRRRRSRRRRGPEGASDSVTTETEPTPGTRDVSPDLPTSEAGDEPPSAAAEAPARSDAEPAITEPASEAADDGSETPVSTPDVETASAAGREEETVAPETGSPDTPAPVEAPGEDADAPVTSAVYEPGGLVATEPKLEAEVPPKRKRRGWWSRG